MPDQTGDNRDNKAHGSPDSAVDAADDAYLTDNTNEDNFTDPCETGYQTATLTNGVAVFPLSPALSVGTVKCGRGSRTRLATKGPAPSAHWSCRRSARAGC